MKTKIKLLSLIIVLIVSPRYNSVFGQATTNNTNIGGAYLGWTGAFNLDYIINGTQYMVLDGATVNVGFVGIGNGFTTPQSLLHLHDPSTGPSLPVYHQWTNGTTGATASDGLRIGIDLNGIAQIIQQENLDMLFYTSNTKRMQIEAGGKVGINLTTSVATNSQFEVNNDINLTTSTHLQGYRISDLLVLSKPWTQNLFIGDGAGTSSTNSVGVNERNTFAGYRAGFSNNASAIFNTGSDNTYIGNQAGENIASGGPNPAGQLNTFVGSFAGQGSANSLAYCNSFFGYMAGNAIGNASFNSIFGCHAGASITTGPANSFFGEHSGFLNTSGQHNSFFGDHTGLGNTTGEYNVAVGSGAGMTNTTHSENVCVGTSAGALNQQSSNTFVGGSSGRVNAGGQGNAFLGYNSGYQNTSGNFNTFLGWSAGRANVTSTDNSFIGYNSGLNSTGGWNVFLGSLSGLTNVGGTFNTYIGTQAGALLTPNSLTNAASIGYQSRAMHDNTLILGNNAVNVGIGLSGEFAFPYSDGPQRKLEILDPSFPTAVPQLRLSYVHDDVTPTLNVYTDFQATPLGDLYIHPVSAGTNKNVGINISNPGNTLEINSNAAVIGPLNSGLKFTDLDNTSATTPNLGLGVLSVDGTGNVIYVPGGIGTVTAQNAAWINGTGDVEWGTNPLKHDTEVPMNDPAHGGEWSVYFTGQTSMPTNAGSNLVDVGIGQLTPSTALVAKLDVINNTYSGVDYNFTNEFAGNFYQTGTYVPFQVSFDNLTGVKGKCDVIHGHDEGINLGGDFYAENARSFNVGARGTTFGASGKNYGIWGRAANDVSGIGVKGEGRQTKMSTGVDGFAAGGAQWNYGVFGQAAPLMGATAVGVYGMVNLTGGPPFGSTNYAVVGDLFAVAPCPPFPAPPCLPVTIPHAAGYFNGDLVTTTAVYSVSDASLKQNIQDLTNPMDIINQLSPKSYIFDQQQNVSMQLAYGIHYGLLSQEVEPVLPGLVKNCVNPARYDSLGNETYAAINFKAINYPELIPFLIAGMKQMDSTNQALQSQINELYEIINNSEPQQLHQNPNDEENNSRNSINVTLASRGIVLHQNDPNPFKEQTTIQYFIPDDAQQVKIIFTDMKGNILKEVEIPEKGTGQLNVYASDLSSGIYSYTIIANGITIDTKKMLKTK